MKHFVYKPHMKPFQQWHLTRSYIQLWFSFLEVRGPLRICTCWNLMNTVGNVCPIIPSCCRLILSSCFLRANTCCLAAQMASRWSPLMKQNKQKQNLQIIFNWRCWCFLCCVSSLSFHCVLQEFFDMWPVLMGEVPPYDGPKTPDGRVRTSPTPLSVTCYVFYHRSIGAVKKQGTEFYDTRWVKSRSQAWQIQPWFLTRLQETLSTMGDTRCCWLQMVPEQLRKKLLFCYCVDF